MPTLVAENLSHEDFHDHVSKHNATHWEGAMKRKVALFNDGPLAPTGNGHVYYKYKTYSPASPMASFWTFPDLLFAVCLVGTVTMQLAFCWTWGYDSTQDGTTDEADSRSEYQAVVAGGVCFAAVCAFFYIQILVNCGAGIIKCLVFTCVGLMLLLAMATVANNLPKLAFSFGAFAVCMGVRAGGDINNNTHTGAHGGAGEEGIEARAVPC